MAEPQEIEQVIARLPRKEFFALVDRLRQEHADEWDREIEEDAESGRPGRQWDKACEEIEAGRLKPLDEILDHPGLP